MTFLPLVTIWLWISALATLAGWTLSAIGLLNPLGYLTFIALVMVVLFLFRKALFYHCKQPLFARFNVKKLSWRFRHALLLGFLVLAVLAFLGGALYAPANYTGLNYRTPRVLQWLAHDHWFWIHTPNYRMNNRACGFEWLTAPLLLFTRSDRLLFLLNFFPFLLLPGLIFSVFSRMGVRPRVAWCWMWLLPTGYTFLLQAGSMANDTFPTIYALAAIDFACRARISKKPSDLWLSVLSAALLTGAKASNLPLLLPWILVFVPSLPLLLERLLGSVAIMLIAACVSFLPTAILNILNCGDWSGLTLERAGMDLKNPLVGLWGNPLLLALNNVVPPAFPLASWWNRSALSLTPSFLARPLEANFENGFHQLPELQTEDWAGLGFGLSLLIGVSLLWSLFRLKKLYFCGGYPAVVLVAPWLALLVFCLKSGMVTGARLIAPYYPLLLPLLLQGRCQTLLVRKPWWRCFAFCTMLTALPLIVLTPGRPLWPVKQVLATRQGPDKSSAAVPAVSGSAITRGFITRAEKVYRVYFDRPDPLANVRASMPSDVAVIGFMADGDDLDISFWRPFGKKRVEHVLLSDSADLLKHLDYVVVGGANLENNHVSLDEWLRRAGAKAIATNTATLKLNEGPQRWYTVKINQ
jgi:hypothetical protein